MQGAGFVQSSGCKVQASGCRVQGSGFRVQGSGFRVQGSGCRVQDAGFRVQGAGFKMQGSGCRVQGAGFRVQGSGCRARTMPKAVDATSSTPASKVLLSRHSKVADSHQLPSRVPESPWRDPTRGFQAMKNLYRGTIFLWARNPCRQRFLVDEKPLQTAFSYGRGIPVDSVFLWARYPCRQRFLMGEVPL